MRLRPYARDLFSTEIEVRSADEVTAALDRIKRVLAVAEPDLAVADTRFEARGSAVMLIAIVGPRD